MDVKYRPEPWQDMGDGMNRITKDALMKLREANELLKRIDGRIRDLDSDGSIHFNPKDQSQKIGELLDSYSTLQKYCGEAGRVVSEHIDKPFLVEMDKFAQKMRDTSILSFETNNRIGSTTTTVLPDAHAGYGSMPQTIQTKKDKITVEDIFKDSPAFDNVLRGEYKELKKQNPDAKLNYEEYKKVVPSTRGFEYKSIEDEQKKLEMIRDIAIGGGIIIATILCPPLGAAAAVVYGAVQIKSGIDGEDWGTHRKLSQEERVGNVIFGGLDAIPVVGVVGKGVKAFKGMSELADLAKLLKFKEGMPGFNPNLGKNVVQSLRDNKAIMLDRLKLVSLKMDKSGNKKVYQLGEKIAKSIDDRTAKSASFEVDGNGLLISKQGGTDFQSWVNKHHTASNKIIDDEIKGVEASLTKKNILPNEKLADQELMLKNSEEILNDVRLNEESIAWFSNALKNEKIHPNDWKGKLSCVSGDGKHLTERELKYINQELKKGHDVDLDQIKSLREQASQIADDYAIKIRSDEKWTQLTKEHAVSKQPSTILGHELENAGITRPPRHEAHHIIPNKQGGLRKYIEKYGIDVNSASNGVFLPQNYHPNWPGQITHSARNNLNEKGDMMFRHGDQYIRYLSEKLKTIDRLPISHQLKREEILKFIENTRNNLLTGKIEFLYKD
ncbi:MULTISPECIES: AHH domain-containing protein [Bacillus cereus group]|uniref:AHH domain-containing protein n=1 Tax=Bacillus cereus group TaxID=86661 RepID=UPI0018F61A41|nr:AHH domain-containing protein [Bacillus cereus]MBJ8007948.1 AHH domain-containing protein [Bacillus cereus]